MVHTHGHGGGSRGGGRGGIGASYSTCSGGDELGIAGIDQMSLLLRIKAWRCCLFCHISTAFVWGVAMSARIYTAMTPTSVTVTWPIQLHTCAHPLPHPYSIHCAHKLTYAAPPIL